MSARRCAAGRPLVFAGGIPDAAYEEWVARESKNILAQDRLLAEAQACRHNVDDSLDEHSSTSSQSTEDIEIGYVDVNVKSVAHKNTHGLHTNLDSFHSEANRGMN
jgi:hypothetical protein